MTDYHIRKYLSEKPLKTWSRLSYLQSARAWAKYAGVPDPTADIRRPNEPRRVPNPITEEQVELLTSNLQGDELVWVLLGCYAGLRASEVARLHPNDWADGTLRIAGKGDRVDVLPIAPILLRALLPYARRRGRCFPAVTGRMVSGTIQRRARRLGIRMRFHQCRHRFGTAVYATTHDLLVTQRLMRHSSPQTTAGYAAVADARSTHVVSALPGAA